MRFIASGEDWKSVHWVSHRTFGSAQRISKSISLLSATPLPFVSVPSFTYVKKPVTIPVVGCEEQSAALNRASYVPNRKREFDWRLGPPLGDVAAKAGRVKFTILPSLAPEAETPDVIVLPPLGRNLNVAELAPVNSPTH